MEHGIEAGTIPNHLPYAIDIQAGCEEHNFSPALTYAVAWRETIRGELNGSWCAATVLSGDGGHGLFQLTSSWPENNWQDPKANTSFAITKFLIPSMNWFLDQGLTGEALIRCIAASFNAGIGGAWNAHLEGNVDLVTTGNDYAADVFQIYTAIIEGKEFK
jgi:hypothetical protein